MDNANSTITRILGYDFMLVSLGSKIVFRHLPRISRPLNFGPKLERACLCKKGAIIHIDEDLAERTLNAYRYAALTLSLQRLSIAIVETNKFYRLESYRNIVTDVFRPDLELSIAVRMSEQAGFNCIMVPDCSDIDTANILNYIASERLVIAGVNPKVANYFKAEHINHGTKPRPRGAVMYNEAIIKKIEVEHA